MPLARGGGSGGPVPMPDGLVSRRPGEQHLVEARGRGADHVARPQALAEGLLERLQVRRDIARSARASRWTRRRSRRRSGARGGGVRTSSPRALASRALRPGAAPSNAPRLHTRVGGACSAVTWRTSTVEPIDAISPGLSSIGSRAGRVRSPTRVPFKLARSSIVQLLSATCTTACLRDVSLCRRRSGSRTRCRARW